MSGPPTCWPRWTRSIRSPAALGWEALLRGLPVRCFGAPFYSGWGLTTDAVDTGRRGETRDIESIAAAALIRYARYVDPVTGRAARRNRRWSASSPCATAPTGWRV